MNELNDLQEDFIEWNRNRLNISIDESKERFYRSMNILGGHKGSNFRNFNSINYEILQVFYNDSKEEVLESYKLFSYQHFLRQLSYGNFYWPSDNNIYTSLKNKNKVHILDYGCGMAQKSRSLCLKLKSTVPEIKLFLVDIPTIRKDFLLWWGEKHNIEIIHLDVLDSEPFENLPNHDLCIVEEFFEHVYNPELYLEKIYNSLNENGFLMTNVNDHIEEFMHVSPNLGILRDKIQQMNLKEIETYKIYQKY